MAFYCEDSNQVRHVNVISITDSGEELSELRQLLEQKGFRHREVYFYDIDILPVKVINWLACNLEELKIKIYVQRRQLRYYLMRLGLPVMLIQSSQAQGSRNNAASTEQEDVSQLLESIYDRYGYDFTSYQPDSVVRSLRRNIIRDRNMSISEFKDNIISDKESLYELLSGLTVRTTEFFRDGRVYEILRTKILPYLSSYPSIRIWCAGCSTGEEPYSLAILLEEAGILGKSLIYATDLSFNNVLQAQNGLYSTEDIKKAEKSYQESGGIKDLSDYFEDRGSYCELKKQYREKVLFFQHSLVDSGVLNDFQLILCRNVLIYFTIELQEKVLQLFNESLDKSGFLILGKSEGIDINGGREHFTALDAKYRIYKRKT